jgi:hypothetical protein
MMYMKNHRKTVSEFYIDLREKYMSSIFIDAQYSTRNVERKKKDLIFYMTNLLFTIKKTETDSIVHRIEK